MTTPMGPAASTTASLAGSAASGDPDERLQRARRIDWRFVLSDPSPGRVGTLGTPDPETLGALRDAGWETIDLSGAVETPGDGDGEHPDLIIVVRPTGADLAGAARRLGPGGSIYVACDGPFGGSWRAPRPLDPPAVARRLTRMGFVDVRVQIHVPGHERRSAIVPMEDPAALRLLLRRRGGAAAGRPAGLAAETLRRTGLLARLAPSASVVARRGPATTASEGDAVSSLVRETASSFAAAIDGHGGRPAPLLLTPSFRASRHVVALVPTPDGARPAIVAKISRQPDSGVVTTREAQILTDIAAGPPIVRDSAPRLLTHGTPWGLPTLLETGLAGDPLDPATVRRDRDGAVARVIPWLAGLVRPSASGAARTPAGDRLRRLLDEPLDAFASAIVLDDEEQRRVASTIAIVAPLRSLPLPDVIEHGDVSHPNLLLTADGGIAAVDWELGEPHGLPGHDLFGFLAYVAIAEAGAATPGEQAAAMARTTRGGVGWVDASAGDYAQRIGLDVTLLPALAVVCWARRVVGLVERLHDGRPRSVSEATMAWLRGHRFMAAWVAAVERAEQAEAPP